MSFMPNDTQLLQERSRRVADNADLLSGALASGDQGQIDDAVEDLLAAYDGYTGQAQAYTTRFGFDQALAPEDPRERDQSTANALAAALLDLQVADVLSQAAQATGEIEGAPRPDALDESVAKLTETLRAMEPAGATLTGATRFAFDESAAAEAAQPIASPDVPTAKAAYTQQVKAIYDALVSETATLLSNAFSEISDLDVEKIGNGLRVIISPIEGMAGGRFVPRVIDAFKRAIDWLKKFLGSETLAEVEARVRKVVDEIRRGEDVLRVFLKYTYDYEQGQKKIAGWLEASQADPATLDAGTRALHELQQQITQAFTIEKRIVSILSHLKWPLEQILKRVAGTLPLDLVMAGALMLVINVTLLRGMDYADTTSIITIVDGVVAVSQRNLVPGQS